MNKKELQAYLLKSRVIGESETGRYYYLPKQNVLELFRGVQDASEEKYSFRNGKLIDDPLKREGYIAYSCDLYKGSMLVYEGFVGAAKDNEIDEGRDVLEVARDKAMLGLISSFITGCQLEPEMILIEDEVQAVSEAEVALPKSKPKTKEVSDSKKAKKASPKQDETKTSAKKAANNIKKEDDKEAVKPQKQVEKVTPAKEEVLPAKEEGPVEDVKDEDEVIFPKNWEPKDSYPEDEVKKARSLISNHKNFEGMTFGEIWDKNPPNGRRMLEYYASRYGSPLMSQKRDEIIAAMIVTRSAR